MIHKNLLSMLVVVLVVVCLEQCKADHADNLISIIEEAYGKPEATREAIDDYLGEVKRDRVQVGAKVLTKVQEWLDRSLAALNDESKLEVEQFMEGLEEIKYDRKKHYDKVDAYLESKRAKKSGHLEKLEQSCKEVNGELVIFEGLAQAVRYADQEKLDSSSDRWAQAYKNCETLVARLARRKAQSDAENPKAAKGRLFGKKWL